MEYLWFTLWFTLLHTMAYTVAGAIALNVSGDLYTERARTLDFLRNMSDVEESGHVQRWFLPAQVVRGVVLSVVLYPVLGPLGDLSFPLRFAFFAGLFFVYLDFASSVPFINNVEGFVYFRRRYLAISRFWKLYLETVLYAVLLATGVAWLLF